MAVQAPSSFGNQHIIGDVGFRVYFFSQSVSNGDTFTPFEHRLESVDIQPSTGVAVGYTINNNNLGNIITFVGGPWSGRIVVFFRLRG